MQNVLYQGSVFYLIYHNYNKNSKQLENALITKKKKKKIEQALKNEVKN